MKMCLFRIQLLSAFAAIAQCTRTLNPDEKTLCQEHAPVDWIIKGLPSNCHLHLLLNKARSAGDLPGLLCRDLRAQGQTLSLVQLWSIASQLTGALLYLRDRNIVHFDLKVSCRCPCRL